MRAVLSLGTNTVRLLVVRRTALGFEQVEHVQTGTRLGEGLRDHGPLAPAAKERTLTAARKFTAVARAHGAALSLIATSAMRRTSDAESFTSELFDVTGARLQILDGATEAAASFRGATYGMTSLEALIGVLDIGGGSTECAVGWGGVFADARSVEIGSVRLTEAYPQLAGNAPGDGAHASAREARADVRTRLASFAELGRMERLIGVAGTALTIGAIAFASHVNDVSGRVLSLETIDATVDRMLDLPLADRRVLPGMLPQRADVLVAGGLILSEALRVFGVREVRLESNDLLLGFLVWDGRGSNPDALTGGKF